MQIMRILWFCPLIYASDETDSVCVFVGATSFEICCSFAPGRSTRFIYSTKTMFIAWSVTYPVGTGLCEHLSRSGRSGEGRIRTPVAQLVSVVTPATEAMTKKWRRWRLDGDLTQEPFKKTSCDLGWNSSAHAYCDLTDVTHAYNEPK